MTSQTLKQKTMEKKIYIEPAMEIIEVAVEKGFAASFPGADGADGPVHW